MKEMDISREIGARNLERRLEIYKSSVSKAHPEVMRERARDNQQFIAIELTEEHEEKYFLHPPLYLRVAYGLLSVIDKLRRAKADPERWEYRFRLGLIGAFPSPNAVLLSSQFSAMLEDEIQAWWDNFVLNGG